MSAANPVLSDKSMRRFAQTDHIQTMSVGGSLIKTAVSLFVLIVAAVIGWQLVPGIGTTIPFWAVVTVFIAAPVIGLIAAFKPGPILVLLYAALEGLIVGGISRFFASEFDGIVVQAVLITLTTTLGMLFLYASGLVKVTKKLRSVIIIATVGIFLYLIVELILSLFVPGFLTAVSSGPLGIAIAALIVIIAALNLLLDFDFITRGVKDQLDKKAEWYAAFGLMVSLVWLYLSILRLLAASRR